VGDGAPARRPNVRAGIQQRRVYYRRMREMAEETLRARWELEEILKQIEEEERRHCWSFILKFLLHEFFKESDNKIVLKNVKKKKTLSNF
jgi:hypothetical protein